MRTLPLVLLAAIVLAGCATTIDNKKAESFITKRIEAKTDVQVKSVSCPTGLTAKAGDTFDCTVTRDDGSTAKAKVTEKDDKGNVDIDLSTIPTRQPLDPKKAEQFVSTQVQQQTGARVQTVSCPSHLTAEQGATFDCTVTGADGTSGKATLTQIDDKGNIRVEAPFLHPADIEQSLNSGISKQIGGQVQIVCPDIVTAQKGGEFECEASSGSEKATVSVTQTDDQGNVDYKIK
jgi:hypothetical protein